MQATIGPEVLERSVVAFVECNPRDDGGDFFGLAHAFGMYTCDDFLQNIKANGFDHSDDGVTGAGGVDGNAFNLDGIDVLPSNAF